VPDPGLPDGMLSNRKSRFGSILKYFSMEDVGIFYVFGLFYGYLAIWYIICFSRIFFLFWDDVCANKNLATLA
jgi:uncharacterized membrane protein YedE/YeeE